MKRNSSGCGACDVAAGLGFAQQPAPVKVEGGLVQGTSEDGLDGLPGHPVRRAAGRRPPLARAAARREMGRRAAGRPSSVPNPIQGAERAPEHERGLPVPERLDAGEVRERPHSRARLDLRRRIRRRAPPPNRTTAARSWPRRAWCWSASPTASGNSDFWRTRN